MAEILERDFFSRDSVTVARELLGCFLVRKTGTGKKRFLITETEAYQGEQDLASHARFGRTKRNAVMYKKGGVFYVYFVYGIHWLLNIVTGREGEPQGVLIRGVEGLYGPAILTKALSITGRLTGRIAEQASGLWFERGIAPKKIFRSPRIGVDYAGPVWSKKLLRFTLKPVSKNKKRPLDA